MSPSINPQIKEQNDNKKITFLNKDYIITLKLPAQLRMLEGNSLVVLKHPNKDELVVRYMLGKSGDWIKEKNSNVYHNIPKNFCWVDCLKGDDDSNTWGPV
jgi:hypothetical protein